MTWHGKGLSRIATHRTAPRRTTPQRNATQRMRRATGNATQTMQTEQHKTRRAGGAACVRGGGGQSGQSSQPRLVSQPASQSTCLSVGQPVGRSVSQPVNQTASHPVGRLVGRSVDRSVSQLVGRPVSRKCCAPLDGYAGDFFHPSFER